jgi:hypothetical protein
MKKPEPSNQSAFEYEVVEEKARALGLMGRQVEAALKAVREFDAQRGSKNQTQRHKLVAHAADRVYSFLVQRELCGMRDWEEVLDFYGVPSDVRRRLGSWPR